MFPGWLPRRLLIFILASVTCAAAADKPEKWLEVRSPHFIVVTNAGERPARRVARQFERFRAVFRQAFPNTRVDPPQPIGILAFKDDKSLKEVLPGYWEKKGQVHPAGVFASGPEKSYVALRLDVAGPQAYHAIYHEYVHLLLRLNFGGLPLWLDEGLAEFYAGTEIHEKDVWVGLPDESHLRELREHRLLPVSELFEVDTSSPYYREERKAEVFYAESWALTHLLMLGESGLKAYWLAELVALLGQGVERREAQKRVLADPQELEKKLEAYLRGQPKRAIRIRTSIEVNEKEFAAREIPSGEAAAVCGDFLVHADRPAEARTWLEQALREDPNSALAQSSMGLLLFRQGRRDEAEEWFDRAVRLNSQSFLAYYYHATLRRRRALDAESAAQVEKELQRSLELNPDYAPACAALANLYEERGKKLDVALGLARRAVALEPQVASHKLLLAGVLLGLGQMDEARKVAQDLLATAKSSEDRAAASAFLEAARTYEEHQAAPTPAAASTAAVARGGRRPQPALPAAKPQPRSTKQAGKPAQPRSAPGAGAAQPKQVIVEGKIAEVSCSSPAILDLTLLVEKKILRLRARNYFKTDFLTLNWKPPDPFHPCEDIKGLRARIVHRPVEDQPYAGEIVSVELRK